MILSDKMAYRQIIGSLMKNTLLFLQCPDLTPADFDVDSIRVCFIMIQNLYNQGATKLTPIEVDQEVEKHINAFQIYKKENGLEFLKAAYEYADISNFKMYYIRLKKYSLLRRLKKEKYDIRDYYIEDSEITDPREAIKIQEKFDNASLEEILNSVESRYNIIRNEYINGDKERGDPAEGIFELIESLKQIPDIGPSLEGKIFSSACRGARKGCFFLKSASTSAGKTRTSVFDACRLAYPVRWSHEQNTFIQEINNDGEYRQPRKVLFIVTEMDKEELQTIMLAYLSGVNEDHILTGNYELGELSRVQFAGKIMEDYRGYFIIEEIAEPNLLNVEATIKKYTTFDNVKYVFFDYIHTTASMVEQFSKNNLNEPTILMMMANQLKQIAKTYGIFIFSATQVNVNAMSDDGEFKNEMCIRGAKSVADKCDLGCVMTRVTDNFWNSIIPTLRIAAASQLIDNRILADSNFRPTHVIDIYKMRRGRYKNVRIWMNLHLGTGRRTDLFMTTADNQPISTPMLSVYNTMIEQPISNWQERIGNNDYDITK